MEKKLSEILNNNFIKQLFNEIFSKILRDGLVQWFAYLIPN